MRYLVALLITIAVIIFVIIKLITGGGGETPATPRTLASYAGTDTSVRYIIDNPVSANDTHRSIIITVGRDQATLTVTKGYEGEVINTQSYPNNTNAYADFLLGLDRTGGFTQGNTEKGLRDERGYCANGDRFSYDIIDENDNRIQHFWSTSCKEKTFRGDPEVVSQLFRAQIPNFDDLTNGVEY